MDFGNTQTTGQVVMGTVPKKIKQPASKLYETVSSLKVITRFVRYSRVKEEDSGPSLLAGGSIGQAGPVHQFHAGTTRLQYPVEDVPQRDDRESRAVPESGNDESESDWNITGNYEQIYGK